MIRGCVFDAFGTLFRIVLPQELASHSLAQEILLLCRQKQLEYSWIYGLMDTYMPFEQLTQMALEFAFDKLKINDILLMQKLQGSFFTPQYYDDVPEVLTHLNTQKIAKVILSNGSSKMLSKVLAHTAITDQFDKVLSAEAAQTFKPNKTVYQLATKALRFPKDEILFVSSNQWDIAGAANYGFQTAWVNRDKLLAEPIIKGKVHYEFESLKSLMELKLM